MNNSIISLINIMYDKKISDLNLKIQDEIDRNIFNPNISDLTYEINLFYLKQVELINLERRNYFNIMKEYLNIQELDKFNSIGTQMSHIKSLNKKHYEYIVDKAFCMDTSLSLYKFKYA